MKRVFYYYYILLDRDVSALQLLFFKICCNDIFIYCYITIIRLNYLIKYPKSYLSAHTACQFFPL